MQDKYKIELEHRVVIKDGKKVDDFIEIDFREVYSYDKEKSLSVARFLIDTDKAEDFSKMIAEAITNKLTEINKQ